MSDTFRIEDGLPYIGDKAFPWAREVRLTDRHEPSPSFHIRAFHLCFENRWTLSITWGTGTYSANHMAWDDTFVSASSTAEIAAWPASGGMVVLTNGGEEVLGWQTTEDVLRWIEDIGSRPSEVGVSS